MDEALVCDFCHKVVQPLRLCACPLCVDFRLNAGLRPEELRTSVGLRSCDECYAELHEDSLLTATTPPPGPATSSGRKDDQAEDKTQNPNDDESYRDGDGVVADLQSELRDLKEALALSERQRSETDSEHAREIATLKNGIKKQKEKAEGLQAELRTQINGQRSVIESLKKERDGLSSRLEQQISKAEGMLSAKDATMSAKLRSAEEKLSATRRELDTVKDRLSKEAQRSREARDQATQERAAKEEKLSQELVAAQKKSSDLERSCEHWQSTASGYERELALAAEKQDQMIEEGIARKSEALRSTLEREADKRVKAQVSEARKKLQDAVEAQGRLQSKYDAECHEVARVNAVLSRHKAAQKEQETRMAKRVTDLNEELKARDEELQTVKVAKADALQRLHTMNDSVVALDLSCAELHSRNCQQEQELSSFKRKQWWVCGVIVLSLLVNLLFTLHLFGGGADAEDKARQQQDVSAFSFVTERETHPKKAKSSRIRQIDSPDLPFELKLNTEVEFAENPTKATKVENYQSVGLGDPSSGEDVSETRFETLELESRPKPAGAETEQVEQQTESSSSMEEEDLKIHHPHSGEEGLLDQTRDTQGDTSASSSQRTLPVLTEGSRRQKNEDGVKVPRRGRSDPVDLPLRGRRKPEVDFGENQSQATTSENHQRERPHQRMGSASSKKINKEAVEDLNRGEKDLVKPILSLEQQAIFGTVFCFYLSWIHIDRFMYPTLIGWYGVHFTTMFWRRIGMLRVCVGQVIQITTVFLLFPFWLAIVLSAGIYRRCIRGKDRIFRIDWNFFVITQATIVLLYVVPVSPFYTYWIPFWKNSFDGFTLRGLPQVLPWIGLNFLAVIQQILFITKYDREHVTIKQVFKLDKNDINYFDSDAREKGDRYPLLLSHDEQMMKIENLPLESFCFSDYVVLLQRLSADYEELSSQRDRDRRLKLSAVICLAMMPGLAFTPAESYFDSLLFLLLAVFQLKPELQSFECYFSFEKLIATLRDASLLFLVHHTVHPIDPDSPTVLGFFLLSKFHRWYLRGWEDTGICRKINFIADVIRLWSMINWITRVSPEQSSSSIVFWCSLSSAMILLAITIYRPLSWDAGDWWIPEESFGSNIDQNFWWKPLDDQECMELASETDKCHMWAYQCTFDPGVTKTEFD